MPISILIITHHDIGAAIVNAAKETLGELPIPTTVVNVESNTTPEVLHDQLQQFLKVFHGGESILILTDLFGSTPCNIAKSLSEDERIRIVSGLNLPMLLKVMNYAHLSIDEIIEKALAGGKDGIIDF